MTNITRDTSLELSLSHEQIAARAQAIWAQRGQPLGQDEEIWFEAERQLRADRPAPAPQLATVIDPTPERVQTSPAKPTPRKRSAKAR
jgi:hypothetical protein